MRGKQGLKVLFTSDKVTSGGGAQCTAECIDPTTPVTTCQRSNYAPDVPETSKTAKLLFMTEKIFYKIVMRIAQREFVLVTSCPEKDTTCLAPDENNLISLGTTIDDTECASE